jgi:plastocyanin
MRWRGIGTLVTGSLVWLGVACSGDDQGPSEPPLVIEKPATKSGDAQTGPVGTPLGNPLRVLITREGEPVEGVNVTWTAAQGGSIGSAQESDELGIATAVWTLGPAEGNQVASAEVTGATNSPLTYTATATPDEPPPPPPGVTVQVLPNNTFDPATLTISPGQSVTWEWEDGSGRHNVTPDDEEPAASGPLVEGPFTFTHTFDTPGTYRYYCLAHGGPGGVGMSGTVVVQAQ